MIWRIPAVIHLDPGKANIYVPSRDEILRAAAEGVRAMLKRANGDERFSEALKREVRVVVDGGEWRD